MSHAVILAGGKGERLRPYTEDRPKPMVPVMGHPLLAHTIRWLTAHGYNQITICCGHMSHVITDFFGDGQRWSAKINYLIEEEPLGRGGALRVALEKIGNTDQPILALNGDVITNLNLFDLTSYHRQHNGTATVVAVPLRSPYGIVDFNDDDGVTGFREKPLLPFWVNAGIYVLDPSVVSLLPPKGDHEDSTFPSLASQGRLKAYRSEAFWRAVDTVKDLTELRADCERVFYGAFFQAGTSVVASF